MKQTHPAPRRMILIGYLLPVALALIACVRWFSSGRFIAGGYVAPYVREGLAGELASMWNHQSVPTGSASFAVVGAPDVLLIRLTGAVGLPAAAAQFLLYAVLFSLAALGASHLTATWVRRPWPVAYAGTMANAYLLVNHPNPVPPLAIGLAGLFAAQVVRAARGDTVRAAPLAALSLGVGYLAQSPSLVGVVLGVVLAGAFVASLRWGRDGLVRMARLALRALPVAILLNLWWLVPYVMTVQSPGIRFTARSDLALWAWTAVVLAYAVLGARALEWTADAVEAARGRLAPLVHPFGRSAITQAGAPVAVLAAIAAFAYPWPLWSGSIAPQTSAGLPGSRVAVPEDWHRLADQINAAPDPGRVLVLPFTDSAEVTTAWGYHGVDQIPAQLLRRPTLQQLSRDSGTAPSTVVTLVAAVQNNLLAGDTAGAYALLQRLGIGHVVVRSDVLGGAPDLPARLRAAMAGVPESTMEGQYAVATSFRTGVRTSAVRLADELLAPADPAALDETMLGLPLSAATTADSALARGGAWTIDGRTGTGTLDLPRAGPVTLNRPTTSDPMFWAQLNHGYLRLTDAETVTVDGRPLPARPQLRVPLNTPAAVAIAVNGAPRILPPEGVPVQIGADATVTAYAPLKKGMTNVAFGTQSTCNRANDAPAPGMELLAGGVTQLTSVGDAACVSGPVRAIAGAAAYRIQIDVRTVSGAAPRLCLWVEGAGCLPAEQPTGGPADGWQRYQTVALASTSAPLQLIAYADGPQETQEARTVVQYRNPIVQALTVAGQRKLTGASAPPATPTLTAGQHRFDFHSRLSDAHLGGFSPLRDCLPGGTGGDKAHSLLDTDGVLRLTARIGIACVQAPLVGGITSSMYELQLDYRTIIGRTARVCVWQEGPDQCAVQPAMTRSRDWQHLDTTFRIASGTRRLLLYAYADGNAGTPTPAPTAVEYRAASVRPTQPTVVVASETGTTDQPTVSAATIIRQRADYYRVRLHNVSGTQVLVLADSYADGWRLDGLPSGWTARHLKADGYANGWLITGIGEASVTLAYSPAVIGYVADALSFAVALRLAVVWAYRRKSFWIRLRPGVRRSLG
jgi:arabinofuranan 3-O-arabinosyltransferase